MRLALSLMFTATLLSAQSSFAAPPQSTPIPSQTSNASPTLLIPAGTQIGMELTRPVWAASAKPGDLFYAETVVPVSLGNQTVIPYGTFVEGTITSFTKPARKSSQALFHLQFDKIIFPNGYTIVLTKPAIRALVTVKVSTNNDLLLDNGAQITMPLRSSLPLNATEMTQAISLAQAPTPGDFVPATLCRPSPGYPGDPGSPGTPDVTIPGNPGTPDITIPGADGAPDTVIPGIPATPDTVIPGMPATPPTPPTPPTVCPDPPVVISSVADHSSHTRATSSSSTLKK
jgi:hypothetical protein